MTTPSRSAEVTLVPVALPATKELGFLTINGTRYKVTVTNATIPDDKIAETLQKIHMIAKTQLVGSTGPAQPITITAESTKIGTRAAVNNGNKQIAEFDEGAFGTGSTQDGYESPGTRTLNPINLASYNTIKTTFSGTNDKCSDVFNSIFAPAPPVRTVASAGSLGGGGSRHVGDGGSLFSSAEERGSNTTVEEDDDASTASSANEEDGQDSSASAGGRERSGSGEPEVRFTLTAVLE